MIAFETVWIFDLTTSVQEHRRNINNSRLLDVINVSVNCGETNL